MELCQNHVMENWALFTSSFHYEPNERQKKSISKAALWKILTKPVEMPWKCAEIMWVIYLSSKLQILVVQLIVLQYNNPFRLWTVLLSFSGKSCSLTRSLHYYWSKQSNTCCTTFTKSPFVCCSASQSSPSPYSHAAHPESCSHSIATSPLDAIVHKWQSCADQTWKPKTRLMAWFTS